MLQPPPGTFGGTLGLGGADGFGGTGENNVMYAGEEQGEREETQERREERREEGGRDGRKSQLTLVSGGCAGDPVTKVDKIFGFKLPPDAVAPRMQVSASVFGSSSNNTMAKLLTPDRTLAPLRACGRSAATGRHACGRLLFEGGVPRGVTLARHSIILCNTTPA